MIEIAEKFDLKLVSIEDLVAYRMQHDSLIHKEEDFDINTRFGTYRLRAYKQTTNNQIHIALTKGNWSVEEEVPTRINSTLFNNDILGTLTSCPDETLTQMFNLINEKGKGAIIFINQESQSLNLLKRLKEIRAQQEGTNITSAPKLPTDTKDFGIGAQILHDLDIAKVALITNSKQAKRVGIEGYGLEITSYLNY